MKLFSDVDERTAVVTVLAGAVLIADVIHRGLPVGHETEEMRAIRIGHAFDLARQFATVAERQSCSDG